MFKKKTKKKERKEKKKKRRKTKKNNKIVEVFINITKKFYDSQPLQPSLTCC